ncbi:MAG TPA: isochorismate synthase [Rhodothermales bacterium]|nr:isochorismate synthase [Rhodothermales bacterium]
MRSPVSTASAADIHAELARQIVDAAASHRTDGRSGDGAQLVRIALPYPNLDPLVWLHAQSADVRIYWAGRNDGLEVAGVGCADSVSKEAPIDYNAVLQRLRSAIGSGPGDLRYFGGIRFDRYHDVSPEWAPYSAYRFWLPRFELQREGDVTRLICNLAFPEDGDRIAEIQDDLSELSTKPPGSPDTAVDLPLSRQDLPDRDQWESSIDWALKAFEEQQMEKIVLARKTILSFSRRLDPVMLLDRVRSITNDCYHFLFQPVKGTAFIGATPERLLSRSGRYIATEAVAGTRPRGDSGVTDAALIEQLLESEKDRREHAYVRQSVAAALAPLCTSFQQDEEVSVMRLARRMHLFASMWGVLADRVSDADLMRALHPTPAVGGVPTKVAMEAIAHHEPFDRGWYAGPVGWIGANASEFAVGIRSALVEGNRVALYAGAGIVEGSTAEGEWDEIEQKISDFTKSLTGT